MDTFLCADTGFLPALRTFFNIFVVEVCCHLTLFFSFFLYLFLRVSLYHLNHILIMISFDVLEKAMATHSSTLAWKIPWVEEPGRLQFMGSQRVGHDWATSLFTFMHWRRKWQPTPVFLLGESQGWGSLVGCHLWGRTESDRLKQLSSSSFDVLFFVFLVFGVTELQEPVG